MVALHELSEAKAKALTIAMNQKRGAFDEDGLASILAELGEGRDRDDLALDVGIRSSDLSALLDDVAGELAAPLTEFTPAPLPTGLSGSSSYSGSPTGASAPSVPPPTIQAMKMVQVLFSDTDFAEFNRLINDLARFYGLRTVSDVVLEALRHV